MEATPITADMVDQEYRAVCAEIGQLYFQRLAASDALGQIDAALASKREALAQVVARHRAVAHNEALGTTKPKGPFKVVEGVPRGE